MDIAKMLRETKAVAEGHFVYKARHNHGTGYVDKDMFPFIGAQNLVEILESEAEKALRMGLDLSRHKKVCLMTPAYGAIKLGLPIAAYLERRTSTKVFVIETEIEKDANGKKYHIIPENQKKRVMGIPLIGKEDIVNNGTTLIEIRILSESELETHMIAAMAIIDRGGQTTRTLGIPGYYPYMRIDMTQHDIRTGPCPQCVAGIPINTDLGKGKEFVAMFGQPPYDPGTDFSKFWV
jgi:orotate phosphoribosyltransferase